MTSRGVWVTAGAAVVLMLTGASRAAVTEARGAGAVPAVRVQDAAPTVDLGTTVVLAADAATPTFQRVCVLCHPPDRIVGARRTGYEWQEIIDKMVTKGARGSDEELQTVFEYLIRHYTKVNVNAAPAEEIAAVLSLSEAQAQAVVKYRAEHGRFTDAASVARVPGLETAAYDPAALVF